MYESGENYLETILMLHQKQGYVRSIDIANELGFTKPSVSRAMSILKNDGYIVVESSGNIVLTEKGNKKANQIYERHLYITKFLQKTLGISEELAARDACRIEHIISQETFERIKENVDS
ncbi:MAG: metal-dependent transcriptional regulator [Clostridium sp.]|nr:metal-dependent transcriptional regulator [Clostridium sp.]MEE0253123.1 metal-dependent transcriptional regulator [Acutalibacteraceae bacterium]